MHLLPCSFSYPSPPLLCVSHQAFSIASNGCRRTYNQGRKHTQTTPGTYPTTLLHKGSNQKHCLEIYTHAVDTTFVDKLNSNIAQKTNKMSRGEHPATAAPCQNRKRIVLLIKTFCISNSFFFFYFRNTLFQWSLLSTLLTINNFAPTCQQTVISISSLSD